MTEGRATEFQHKLRRHRTIDFSLALNLQPEQIQQMFRPCTDFAREWAHSLSEAQPWRRVRSMPLELRMLRSGVP